MKTLMTAALVSLMITPAAFAAAPMVAKAGSKPALASQTTPGGAILLVKGGNKPGNPGPAKSGASNKNSFYDRP